MKYSFPNTRIGIHPVKFLIIGDKMLWAGTHAFALDSFYIFGAYDSGHDGEWVNSSRQCMDALRRDIGFDGVVVSDFLAIHHDKVASHNNGMDIELADPAIHRQEIRDALETGEITEAVIDDILRRQLKMALHSETLDNSAEMDMEIYHEK